MRRVESSSAGAKTGQVRGGRQAPFQRPPRLGPCCFADGRPPSVHAGILAFGPYRHTSIRGGSKARIGASLGTRLPTILPYTHTRLLRTQRDAAPLSPAAPSLALHPYAAAPNAAGRPVSGRFVVHGTDVAVWGSRDLCRRMPAADVLCPDDNHVVGGLRIRHPAPKRAHGYTKPKTAHTTQFFWLCCVALRTHLGQGVSFDHPTPYRCNSIYKTLCTDGFS